MKKIFDFLAAIFSHPPQDIVEVKQKESGVLNLILPCSEKDVQHLDSLTRYYEMDYGGLLTRGVWLATLMRDAEIANKRLAVVEIDEENGDIRSISPITLG